MTSKIEISARTIIFTVVFLLSLWVLIQIIEIIFWLFVAFILMSALKPVVDYFESLKVPRIAAIIIIYIFILILLTFTGSTLLPPLINQSVNLGTRLPEFVHSVWPVFQSDPQVLTQQLAPLGQNLLKFFLGVFGNIVALFTIFVITFYLLLERKKLEENLIILTGNEAAGRVLITVKQVEERLGAWVRGQVALVLSIGIFTFIGLTILGIPYALSLAIIAGILEIVPNFGPVISAIPAVLVALTISPILAAACAVLYLVIQQIENHLVVPYVMKKVVGLPPLVTIIALLVGAKLAGIAGAILAVPVVVTGETIISEWLRSKDKK